MMIGFFEISVFTGYGEIMTRKLHEVLHKNIFDNVFVKTFVERRK